MALPQGNAHKDSGRKGFTLIAIGLMMLAFGVYAMSLLTPGAELEKERSKLTQNRINDIRFALNTYYKTNSNLYPCPARMTSAIDSAGFGTSVNACAAATDCTTAGGGIYCPASTTKTWVGMVPVKTLNLSDDYAFDEWGRRLTYAVNNNNTFAIKNLDNLTIGSSKTFVVSHGKNGKGAGLRQGTLSACTASGTQTITNSELGNCNFNGGSSDDIFIYSPWSTNINTYYDDITFRFDSD